ncbi:uncharacterized protein LOC123310376 [Coccinella septempunctata]|uniref:uncharacterized protein LOC123310376 n=1 Tax=Coccinella septempunctata TaxID=41139 RepID=UPI001D0865D4|nr:uncharacterized protein LOC123310376 [Coccinella septempunctata]
MDEIIESVNEINAGFKMNNRRLRVLCYADDALLVAENEDDLQRLLHRFNLTAQKLNMEISCEKTQSMVVSKEPIRCKLVVNGSIVNQVMNVSYLGVETSSNRCVANEVDSQVKKAARISGCLQDVIWRNKYMSTESKTRIYKTCIRPILTYAAETRAETSETKRKMRTTEMRILRTIRGITLRDRIRNTDTLRELGIRDVFRWVRTRRRYWRDHVDRMGPDRIAKWAKTQKPGTRRPVGRPPKRWHDSWTSVTQEGR